MKGLLIVATLVAGALARPDIGLKLREQALNFQSTNYGIPTGSYLPATGSGTATVNGANSGSSSQATGHGVNSGSVGSYGLNEFSGQNGYNSESFSSSSSSISGLSQVQKHVYFYDAPEDHDAPQLRIRVQPSAAKQNVKIIFIKTPSYKTPVIQQIPAQGQNEEKTRIYVLVKKQDDAQEIVIPTSVASKPSKPEVFFIKYKTQKEAEEKIHEIQLGGSTGINANAVGSDSFVSTITDTRENHDFDDGNINTGAGVGVDINTISSGSVTTNIGHEEHSHESGNQVINSQVNANYGPAGVSGPY